MKASLNHQILFIIFFLSGNIIAQTDENNKYCGKLEVPSVKYLLFDNVNLRKEPSAKAELVKTIPIGSTFKIKSESDSILNLYGYSHHWYEVVLLDKNKKETNASGYLWGGFFALGTLESENDPGVIFLYGLLKMNNEDGWQKPYMQMRAIMGDKEIAQVSFESVGGSSTPMKCNKLGNKGIRNINEIFQFSFSDDYCGGFFGDVYIFWDKAILHHARTLRSGADAPVFSNENLIFPVDEGGKEGRIILYEDAGEDTDTGTQYEYQRKTELIWTGCELKSTSNK